MQLYEMQACMSQALFSDRPDSTEACALFKSTPRLSAAERLAIYNGSYWCRVVDCFYEDFPGLFKVLGKKQFDKLATDYLKAHPSRSFSLRDLGQDLPAFIAQNAAMFGDKFEIALDMARLEWADIEAFDNAELRALSLADIAKAGADSHFKLQPHLRLLKLSYPVDDIRLAKNARGVNKALQAGPRPFFLAVHRADLSVYYKSILAHEFYILEALERGERLEDALSDGFLHSGLEAKEQSAAVVQSFETWATLGWLCRGPNEHRRSITL